MEFPETAPRLMTPVVISRRECAQSPPVCLTWAGGDVNFNSIPAGLAPPTDLYVIIENTVGGPPVKYEIDKKTGAIFVDRFLHTAMNYPGNYGFIPGTLSEDGDPCDALVIPSQPVIPGAVVRCRPIGARLMTDEAGADEKILCVPVDKLHPFYQNVREHSDLPAILCEQITHFFAHYKDLEPGKWSGVGEWVEREAAEALIVTAVARAASTGWRAAQ